MPRLIVRSVTGCHDCSYDRSQDATSARTIGHRMPRLIVRSVTGCHDCSYDRSQDATSARTLGHRMPRLLVRSVTGCHECPYARSQDATIDRTLGHRMPRLLVRSVTGCHECPYDRSQDATIARTIGCRMQRSIDRTIGRRPSRLIVHRSLIATTSCTISYDGSCHRYSPIVRDSATTRRGRSRYAAGDRSKHCRTVAPWPNRIQSYDPEIV